MQRKVFLSGLLVFLIWPLLLCLGQQPPNTASRVNDPQDVVRVSTAAVQFEAIITDKSGLRVSGFSASDFQILDETKPVAMDFFAVVEGSRLQTANNQGGNIPAPDIKEKASASPLLNPYRGRYIALVFDDLDLTPDNFQRSRLALTDYIKTKMGPEDMMALVSTAGRLGSLQQFTSDKLRLVAALNRLSVQVAQSHRLTSTRYNMTIAEALRIDAGDRGALDQVMARAKQEEAVAPVGTIADQTLAPRDRQAAAVDDSGKLDMGIENGVRAYAKTMLIQHSQITRSKLNLLAELFKGMAELPGRKIVLMLTESFITAGGTTEDVSNELPLLINRARQAGVSFYAVDAAGLHTNGLNASDRLTSTNLFVNAATAANISVSDFEKLGTARALVAGTGGNLIANTNDLSAGLERAVEDSNSYYLLGFHPQTLDNKFHHLAVTIKGRPDLVVRTRQGYLAVNEETARGTETELAAALISPIPRTDLPLEVIANAVPSAGVQVVAAGFHVGYRYLSPPAEAGKKADYDIVAWLFGSGDRPVGVIQTTLSYDLANPDTVQRLRQEGFVLARTFTQLPPGYYQLRAVVREKNSGLIGTGYQFFEIPDAANKKLPSMSSLVVTPAGETQFRGHNAFKPGSEIDVRYVIYNLPKDISQLTQTVRLLDSQGRALMSSPLPIGSSNDPAQAGQGTRLSLSMVRGHYALLIKLINEKTKLEVERRADLVVE